MPFDREQSIQDIITKRCIEESNYESQHCKASRDYLWSRMTDAILTEEPISFYSTQMKKYFAPPEIKAFL